MRQLFMGLGIVLVVTAAAFAAKDIYYCPMHPSYTSDKPGNCPICNMSLVKKDAGAGLSDEDKVKKHLGDICLMHNCDKGHDGRPCPMMAVVKKGEKVTCPICGSHIAGFPENTDVNAIQTTIKIDSRKRQLIGVKTSVVEERKIVRTIRAYGQVAQDERWIYAQIYEYERPALYADEQPLVGLHWPVTVDVPAIPGKTFTGKVRLLDRDMDPVTRTTTARIELDQWNKILKKGMSANVNIEIDLGKALAVSQDSVLDTGTRKIVFVDRGEGLIEPREVVLGDKGDSDYEVLAGLKAGEKVIVSGNFLIDSESRLKAVLENAGSDNQSAVTKEHQH